MRKFIALILSVTLIMIPLSACGKSDESDGPRTAAFARNVAREVQEDGWVYTFVYEWTKDPDPTRTDNYSYQFFGMNVRYKYDENYIERIDRVLDNGTTFTEIIYPTVLLTGGGSAAESRDMKQINGVILDNSKTVEELLALNPDDYTFEAIDKDMFFRLMRDALTGEPQKEGPLTELPEDDTELTYGMKLSYWDLPSWAMLVEPDYMGGYKFQIAFMQETGCVDVLYIDILYQTGDGYADYVQLSDMVDDESASDGQKQAFELIRKIAGEIEESEYLLTDADSYKDAEIGGIDFSRLYTFLYNMDQVWGIDKYIETPKSEIVQEDAE